MKRIKFSSDLKIDHKYYLTNGHEDFIVILKDDGPIAGANGFQNWSYDRIAIVTPTIILKDAQVVK